MDSLSLAQRKKKRVSGNYFPVAVTRSIEGNGTELAAHNGTTTMRVRHNLNSAIAEIFHLSLAFFAAFGKYKQKN